jgi:hypothetical protein
MEKPFLKRFFLPHISPLPPAGVAESAAAGAHTNFTSNIENYFLCDLCDLGEKNIFEVKPVSVVTVDEFQAA